MRSMPFRGIAIVAIATIGLPFVLGACGGGDSESSATAAGSTEAQGEGSNASLSKMLPADIRSAGSIRVASAVPFPPFESFASEGSSEIVGIDPDLAHAMGEELGVEFDFSNLSFDGIIPALQAGKYDIAMTSMSDTKEREEVLDLVDYAKNGAKFLVEKGNPEGIETPLDVCGKAVAVSKGTTFQEFLTGEVTEECEAKGSAAVEVLEYPNDSEGLLALESGKAAAVLTNASVAGYTAKTAGDGSKYEVVEDPAAPSGYLPTLVGIGMVKDQPELREAIKAALQVIIDNGKYQEILDRYGAGSSAIEKVTVNVGS